MIITLTTLIIAQEPDGQPRQIKTKVQYDENLKHPFFDKTEFHFGDPEFGEDPKRKFVHTAKCFTSHQIEHYIHFCEAKLISNDTIEILIHELTPSTNDNLKIIVSQGQFSCQYWTSYVGDRGDEKLVWTTKKQNLKLNKKRYKKGEVMKGEIKFECLQEVTNPKYKGRFPRTIKIEGVFKPIIK